MSEDILRVNFDDIEHKAPDAGGGPVYYYQRQPFTGTLEELYSNGNLLGEIEVVDSHTDGALREYYENGQIKEEYFKRYNRLYGNFKQWDKDGNLTMHYEYDVGGNLIRRIV